MNKTYRLIWSPGWPLQIPPPVAGSKSPTLGRQNGV